MSDVKNKLTMVKENAKCPNEKMPRFQLSKCQDFKFQNPKIPKSQNPNIPKSQNLKILKSQNPQIPKSRLSFNPTPESMNIVQF